jgi:DNA-directed RNA polymerase subunit RPC12/RpoP
MKKSTTVLRCLACQKKWEQDFPSNIPARCKLCGSFKWVEDKMYRSEEI